MTSNQQSKPPTLLIPDTLPPTPIIGVGTGIMGKLCITRSGRIFIRIGENKFWVQNGAECTGAQHLIYMDKDRKSVADLGDVTQRLVCVPDIDNLGIK
ncbi:MAG: hypothetical protein EZS28_021840 [Streblomastix strix]|uniref:Uncharacterized protein n=1 Tax=Streblomastix strix TaxID=222440 RepID=A0A5J4VJ62_9EUKA|nr:MAG: hypothetical protein EZS28_021840 [Streblomastix strix]